MNFFSNIVIVILDFSQLLPIKLLILPLRARKINNYRYCDGVKSNNHKKEAKNITKLRKED